MRRFCGVVFCQRRGGDGVVGRDFRIRRRVGQPQPGGQRDANQRMLSVQAEHAPPTQPVGFRVAGADVAILEHSVGRQTANQADDESAGAVIAPMGNDGGVCHLNAGGQGLADFVAQGVEHHRVCAIALFQRVAHHNQVGNPGYVAGCVFGRRQVQVGNGVGQCAVETGRLRFRGLTRGGRRFCPFRRIVRDGFGRLGGGVVCHGGDCGGGVVRDFIRIRVIVKGFSPDVGGVGIGGVVVVVFLADLRHGVGFVGHQHPIHQVNAADFDVAFFGDPEHQLFEAGEAQLALVKAGDAAHQPLLQRGEQQGMPGGAFAADDVLDGPDDFGQLMAARIAQLLRRREMAGTLVGAAMERGFNVDGVDVRVVENQPVHVVGHTPGGGPGYAYHQHPLAHGAQGVDDVNEVGVAGHQDEGRDVGEVVRRVDAVGGHLHVNAVLDGDGAAGVMRPAGRQSRRDVHRLDAGRVQRRGVLDKLAGPLELGSAGYPIGIRFPHHHPAVIGNFLFQGRHVGRPAPRRQAYLEVLPINE